jgi:hypothetical protein
MTRAVANESWFREQGLVEEAATASPEELAADGSIYLDDPAPLPPASTDARNAVNAGSLDGWPEGPSAEAFHGVVGELAITADPYSEADPSAVLLHALGAFSAAIGKGPHALVGAERHPLVVPSIIVGDSAKARKGHSLSPVAAVFSRACPDFWRLNVVPGGLSSAEGLIAEVRDERRKIVEGEEVVVVAGVEDKRRLIVESEFASVLRRMRREGNTLSAVLRQVFDHGNLRTMTKADPLVATGAHVVVLGHITIEELRRELQDVDATNGFANRFLWGAVTRSKLLADPTPFAGAKVDALANRMAERVAWASNVGEVRRDTAARGRWIQIYEELSAPIEGFVGSVLARAEALVLRLACLYALADGSPVVRVTDLEAALALWRYVERSVRFIFTNTTGDPIAERILVALRRTPNGLSRTSIYSTIFSRNVPRAQIEAALLLLDGLGLATRTNIPTGGRPEESWSAT